VLAAIGTEAELQQIADEGFVAYYSENPAASVRGRGVDEQRLDRRRSAWPFGILGVWVPWVILQNAQNLGVTARRDVRVRRGRHVLPVPRAARAPRADVRVRRRGGRPAHLLGLGRARAAAARRRARRGRRSLFTVAIGLVFFLFVSGSSRAFVTPAPWPWPVKIGIGVLALGGFLAYMLVLGGGPARGRDRRPRRVRRGREPHRR
jgi:hypothetical protein